MTAPALVGGALTVLAALLFGRGYAAFIKKREAEGEELLRFLLHIKGEVGRFLATPERIVKSFRSDVLAECGFLPLCENGALYDAFLCAGLSLSGEVRELLADFLRGFGENYLEGEILRCEDFYTRLSALLCAEREANAKSVRVVKTVSAAAALGVVILLI